MRRLYASLLMVLPMLGACTGLTPEEKQKHDVETYVTIMQWSIKDYRHGKINLAEFCDNFNSNQRNLAGASIFKKQNPEAVKEVETTCKEQQ